MTHCETNLLNLITDFSLYEYFSFFSSPIFVLRLGKMVAMKTHIVYLLMLLSYTVVELEIKQSKINIKCKLIDIVQK